MALSIRDGSGYNLPGGTTGTPLTVTMGGDPNPVVAGALRAYSATAAGGTAPYTYAWTLTDGFGVDQTGTMSAPAAASGTYTPGFAPNTWVEQVTVTDSLGAVASGSRVLFQAGTADLSVTSTGSSTTMASLVQRTYSATPSGGQTPYTYAWALYDPYGTNVATSLMSAPTGASGTYTPYWAPGVWVEVITVTDARPVTASAVRVIIQEEVMSLPIYSDWQPVGTADPPAPITANTVVVV